MRWPWRGRRASDPPAKPLRVTADALDPATLDVIELDVDGRMPSSRPRPADAALRELPDRPPGHDPTGLAGIWKAIAQD